VIKLVHNDVKEKGKVNITSYSLHDIEVNADGKVIKFNHEAIGFLDRSDNMLKVDKDLDKLLNDKYPIKLSKVMADIKGK